MNEIFNELFNYTSNLEIVDTHEHLPYKESARDKNTDVLKEYLIHYFSCDLLSSGMPIESFNKVVDGKLSIMEKWNIVEPYWENSRNTGYGRSLDFAVNIIYGIDGIDRRTIEELNKQFIQSLNPGHFRKVLKERSKIRISLIDQNLDCDKEFFRSVYRIDPFVRVENFASIEWVERESRISITSLEDWIEASEKLLGDAIKRGAVAFKCGLAYRRTLKYDRASRMNAEAEFNKVLGCRRSPGWHNAIASDNTNFENYMMHVVLRFLNKHNSVLQVHTGLQEGNGNILTNSKPTLLSNLFLEYTNIKFDIFHMGYPYQNELAALAKNFPNVFIDMCWAHIISPVASVNALVEWLDSVPANKISAFGGDYCFIDGVAGHQYLARKDVTKALTIKVKEKDMSIERAAQIAEMLFISNPCKLFDLKI